jgi:hypothetical protein
MKKLTTILLTTFLLHTAKAQITLDTTFNAFAYIGYGYKIVQISATESKWYFADTVNNTFSLYNMDRTPFITNVAVPLPFSPYNENYQAIYITRTLFDCDSSNIEYLYEAPSSGHCYNTVFIMRTDGTQLFRQDSARCPYLIGSIMGGSDWVRPIVNTSSGARLFICHPYCGSNEFISAYSLCGSIPTETFDFTNTSQQFVSIFPNPSSNSLTFEIHPPSNLEEFQLVIIDNNGTEVKREQLKDNYHVTVDVTNFSNGNYFYSLFTKSKSYQSGKFIITK